MKRCVKVTSDIDILVLLNIDEDDNKKLTTLFRKYRNIMRFLKDSYFDRRCDTTNYITMTAEDYEEYLILIDSKVFAFRVNVI